MMIVNPDGELVKSYQKTFLYESDEIWASEGSGFSCFNLKPDLKVGLAICMDLNPYKFQAPFEKFELGNYLKSENARGLICSMAWRMIDDKTDETDHPAMDDEAKDPLAHIDYWILRLKPLQVQDVFCVFLTVLCIDGKDLSLL